MGFPRRLVRAERGHQIGIGRDIFKSIEAPRFHSPRYRQRLDGNRPGFVTRALAITGERARAVYPLCNPLVQRETADLSLRGQRWRVPGYEMCWRPSMAPTQRHHAGDQLGIELRRLLDPPLRAPFVGLVRLSVSPGPDDHGGRRRHRPASDSRHRWRTAPGRSWPRRRRRSRAARSATRPATAAPGSLQCGGQSTRSSISASG